MADRHGCNNPNWKGGKIQKTCINCGEPFLIAKHEEESHNYCSMECVQEYRFKNKIGMYAPSWVKYGKDNFFHGKNFAKKGSESPTWRGGVTPLIKTIRTSSKYLEWRLMVFGRDNFTCLRCEKRGDYLEAHHKISLSYLIRKHNITSLESASGISELWDIGNGATLCGDCHELTFNYKGRGRH